MNMGQIVCPHRSGNTGIKGADKKRQQFISEDVNTHNFRGEIVVPNGYEGTAYFAYFQILGEIGHKKQHKHGK